jgi:polyisoprenoid-binding protein YceI
MATTTRIAAGTWNVDTTRTRAGFAARNFGVRTVHGTIAVSGGTISVDADGRPVRLAATLDAGSVDTGNGRRDTDLRGRRFLNVANHPTIVVSADRIIANADRWRAEAVLRVAGAEAPLTIDAATDGSPGRTVLHVTGTARLDLRAAGIRVPGFMVGRYIDITISADLTPPQ